jgi:hypothetical protein
LALSYTSFVNVNTNGPVPNLLEIYELLVTVQKVFPNIFITSNRAEHFNSVHDRSVSYRGRKTPERANNRLNSWILFKYFPTGLKNYLVRHPIRLPMSILQKSYHLQFESTKFK